MVSRQPRISAPVLLQLLPLLPVVLLRLPLFILLRRQQLLPLLKRHSLADRWVQGRVEARTGFHSLRLLDYLFLLRFLVLG